MPKITPELLDEIEKYGHHGTNFDWDSELKPELLRLARLGLWAEEQAIPAMKHDGTDLRDRLREALEELPK